MVTRCHRGGDHRTMATWLVFVLAAVACTGDAFKIYDILDSERIKDSISSGDFVTLEDCTSTRCHEAGLSRITRAVCVLQCFLKTSSSPDPEGTAVSRSLDPEVEGDDLRERELDPLQACIEAKCLDSRHYMQCAYDQCLTSRRTARQTSDLRGADLWRADLRDVMPARGKRPIELCSSCFPNSASWPRCRSSCGK